MAFKIEGRVLRGKWQNFTLEIEAETENYAVHKAMSKLGGNYKVPRTRIKLDTIKKV